MRLRLQIAALCLAALAAPVSARPFTAKDLLAAEEFGQVGFSPDGRHLVFERWIGQAQAGPFDQDIATGYRRSRLYVVDLRRGGAPRPLLPQIPNEGQVAGPVSPDGARLTVLRFAGDAYEVGVVALATGEVRWFGVSPELGWLGQTVVWRGPDELLIAARPKGQPPLRLRVGPDQRRTLARLWATTARGQMAAVRSLGSGRRLAATPVAPSGALLRIEVVTGRTQRLAEGAFYDLELSPDGRRLAAMERLEPVQAPPDWPLQVAGDFQRRNLRIVDLATGAVSVPCPRCHLATHLIAWSPDNREILVYGQPEGAYRGPSGYIQLSPSGPLRLATTPGLAPVIDRTSEGYEVPRAAWLAGAPVVLARPMAGGRADWWRIGEGAPANITGGLPAEPGPLAGRQGEALLLAVGGAAWRIEAGGLPHRLFAAKSDLPPAGLGLSSRRRLNAPAHGTWFRTLSADGLGDGLRTADGRRLVLRAASGRSLALAAGPHAAAEVRRDPAGPMSLDLILGGGRRRSLLQLNGGLRAVDFAKTVLLPADAEGERHILLLPRQPAAGALPPLVVIPYPGLTYRAPPEPYGRGTGRFSANAEVLTGAGFAVLLPSLPRLSAEPGEGLANQILAAVDAASATGRVDADRLAVFGHSFGGYAALMSAAQSPRFKAAIASGAPANLTTMYGAFDPHLETHPEDGINLNANFGWAELGQGALGVPPWADPELYRRNSPTALVNRITAPVLLIHGDADFIRLSHAQEMFAALYRQGKDAELVTYFGEGHIVSSPANLKDMYARIIAWLGDTLGSPPTRRDGSATKAFEEARRAAPQNADGSRDALAPRREHP